MSEEIHSTQGIIPIRYFPVPLAQAGSLPSLIVDAGENAAEKFIEFFTAQIRNRNTREAYARAVGQFMAWCEKRGLSLHSIRPVHVAAYIEKLSLSPPSVKQHLAAIRMLFDWLVVSQVIPMNPAAAVRGPKYVVKRGKTPVLSPDQARKLLDSIKTDSVVGLRDRAIIGVMVYSFARGRVGPHEYRGLF
jgi:site-specific recombinase XerD